jgi:hypothetical protein
MSEAISHNSGSFLPRIPPARLMVTAWAGAATVRRTRSFADASPAFGSPAAGQAHGLTATALAVSSPPFGTPSLAQTHALTATAFTVGAPGGAPSIVCNLSQEKTAMARSQRNRRGCRRSPAALGAEMNDLFDIFGPALIASFSSAICYLVARRDFPPRDAVLVVIGVLIVGPVLAQIVSAWVGVSAGWLGLFFGFALIWTIDQVTGKKPYRN